MHTDTLPFDPAKHLVDDAAISVFIDDALETGNPAYIQKALGVVARAKGMTHIANEAELSRESLYRALSEGGNAQFSTILSVLKAMGYGLSVRPST